MENGGEASTKTPLLEADDDESATAAQTSSASKRAFMQRLGASVGGGYQGLVQDDDHEQDRRYARGVASDQPEEEFDQLDLGSLLERQAHRPPPQQPTEGDGDGGYNSCQESEDEDLTDAASMPPKVDSSSPAASSASSHALSRENLAKLPQPAYDEAWLTKKTGKAPPTPPPLPDLAVFPPAQNSGARNSSGSQDAYHVPTLPPQPGEPFSSAVLPPPMPPPMPPMPSSALLSRSSSPSSSGAPASAAENVPRHSGGSIEMTRPQEVAQAPMTRDNSGERHCFMCLMEEDDEEADNPLVACCTTCYARVHIKCWREWRNNQRVTALRSRLLGLRTQTNNLLRCTICKSGTAVVSGEEDGLDWMNDMLCNGGEGNAREVAVGGLAAALARREESDGEGDGWSEELADMKTCVALVVYLSVLVLVLLTTCVLIFMHQFYACDVVLCCIIALYELSILQLVGLAIVRRRSAMIAAAQPHDPRHDALLDGEPIQV